MEQKEYEFNKTLTENLIKYRKANNYTQAELATKINYSDKNISKWERGESFPDIYTLSKLARIYKVTVNDLLEKSEVNISNQIIHKRNLIVSLSIGLVLLVSMIIFAFLELFEIKNNYYIFLFALSASSIVVLVFSCIWHYLISQIIAMSILIWSLAITFDLMVPLDSSWVSYIIAIPLQLLAFLFVGYKYLKYKKTK